MQNNHLSSKSSSIKQEIKRGPAIHYMPYLHQHTGMSWQLRLAARLAAAALTLSIWLPALAANQIDIVGPSGSGSFGSSITVLTNGNFVVTDPGYDIPSGATDVGAVYLYDGATHSLISTLTGSTSGDQIGSKGVIALNKGSYLVFSPAWDNGNVPDAGAVTWGSGNNGISGEVSSSNSLVGSTIGDQVGNTGVYMLSNGNYVVLSPNWHNGNATDAGAITWGSSTSGVSGEVSSGNSLVGSTNSDSVGSGGVIELNSGNYLVLSPNWHYGSLPGAGAVTWGSGTSGVSGEVSSNNSLVGSTNGGGVGSGGVTVLGNGNYVVRSPLWDSVSAINTGAVTWGSGTHGVSGEVSSSNSLIGSKHDDRVGEWGVTMLINGNYVVSSPYWDNGSIIDVGAVTWGSGTSGINGKVSSSNSLVGSKIHDRVGEAGGNSVTALRNGNYVVQSRHWHNGNIPEAGAVTWGNGNTGITGEVSPSNSLIGSTSDDAAGDWKVKALSNGNYLVVSPVWDNDSAPDAGAVTWGNGDIGVNGEINSSNSLVGSTSSDLVGHSVVTELNHGNYLVVSANWDNGSVPQVGAVTWGSGDTGVSGEVSSSNSLVGSTSGDVIGSDGVIVLTNGNYVVTSLNWQHNDAKYVGAVTWGSGSTGVSGEVSSSNSLVGSRSYDRMGSFGVTALRNGNYVVNSANWFNEIGAVTWGNGNTGVSGEVSPSNSLIGSRSMDQIGGDGGGVTELSNGNYVVVSPGWNNFVGAVTWGNGNRGVSGEVSSSNSFVGRISGDHLGYKNDENTVTVLNNGNYVVRSPSWYKDNNTPVGAVTWFNGNTGTSGEASSSNSLVGSTSEEGIGGVTLLNNGDYVVSNPIWDNGSTPDAGAVTWGNGSTGVSGSITISNSILGTVANAGPSISTSFNTTYRQLIIGRPSENMITLLILPEPPTENGRLYLPVINR